MEPESLPPCCSIMFSKYSRGLDNVPVITNVFPAKRSEIILLSFSSSILIPCSLNCFNKFLLSSSLKKSTTLAVTVSPRPEIEAICS
ncbi:hypothetical protein D3C80_2049760 [compost metagenome]